MNCPKCGAPIEAGKAYCENPACGAVPAAAAEVRGEVKMEKELKFKLVMDFTVAARAAAVLIAVLAAVYVYFFAAR